MGKKLSAYNLHVKKEMKAGKTMKQAAASWKGSGSSKTKRSKSRSSTRKSSTRRNSSMKIGGFSPMGIVKAAALYIGTAAAVSRVAPQVQAIPGGVEAAAGGIAMATGLPGNAFLALGVAKYVGANLLRLVGGVSTGGGGGSYDY